MKKTAFIAALFALPFVAAAQGRLTNLQQLIGSVGQIVGMLIPIVIGLAMLAFFWGLFKYIKSSGEGHKEGVNVMIAGVAALFVMVSVWGIVQFAQSALGISGTTQQIQAPRYPTN